MKALMPRLFESVALIFDKPIRRTVLFFVKMFLRDIGREAASLPVAKHISAKSS